MKPFDAIVIGLEKGGDQLVGGLVSGGNRVAVIESFEKITGKTVLNMDGVPSNVLIHSSECSAVLGGSFSEKAERYAAAILEEKRFASMAWTKRVNWLRNEPQITVIIGKYALTGENTVSVDLHGGGREEVKADHIYVNTGSGPSIPGVSDFNNIPSVYTSENLTDLENLPERLLILGSGDTGLECAFMFANFGSKVTLIEGSRRLLRQEEEEMERAVRQNMMERGISILPRTSVVEAQIEDGKPVIIVEEPKGKEKHYCDALLIVPNQEPAWAELCPKAGETEQQDAKIHTDGYQEAVNALQWRTGDSVDTPTFVPISLGGGQTLRSRSLSRKYWHTAKGGSVPYSIFLDPPFSRVGLTEQEARKQGYEVRVARLLATKIPGAQLLEKTEGLLKVIIDANTEHILGAHLFCTESPELIHLFQLAIDAGIPYTVLRDTAYIHPTMSEALNILLARPE